ncbi:hypothetical protein ACB098_09G117400 [Castanea mollissima]
MSTSRKGRRTLKDYTAYGRKTTLIGNNIRISLKKVITSLGRLGLGGPRHRTLLRRCRKVHHLHFLLPTCRVLTSIQVPPLFLCLPLKYSRPTLLPSVSYHRLGGK